MTLAAVGLVLIAAALAWHSESLGRRGLVGIQPYQGEVAIDAVIVGSEGYVIGGTDLPDMGVGVAGGSGSLEHLDSLSVLESPPIEKLQADSRFVYASTACFQAVGACLLRSADAGRTWMAATSPYLVDFTATRTGLTAVIQERPRDRPRLSLSTDGGDAWELRVDPCDPDSEVPAAVGMAGDTTFLVCGRWDARNSWLEESGWRLLADGGGEWLELASSEGLEGELAEYRPTRIEFQDGQVGWMLLNGHLFFSSTSGRAWVAKSISGVTIPFGTVRSVALAGPGSAIVAIRSEGTGSELAVTQDSGKTWESISMWPWAWP